MSVFKEFKNEAWITQASLEELQEAVREEPPESYLFHDKLGKLFWEKYRQRTEERYGGRKALRE